MAAAFADRGRFHLDATLCQLPFCAVDVALTLLRRSRAAGLAPNCLALQRRRRIGLRIGLG